MILRKLTIFGFKSFAEKTELQFGEGMTAVIGPNGCGKSNVVDAIRWVFGEQKTSVLRSTSMQDVIFSGTQNRSPLNIAEVTLTIENRNGVLPVEYRDVAITRRVYRSGESEYRINKVPCRLRDIHNLFLDTGIGNSAYTTIENGMINSILSDKAEERRILFEEASGIGKYKQRRKESQRQLEKTRQDLLRINDKVQEADRQVRMLARHVEKAKRYKSYFEDLKGLEIGFENRRYQILADAIKKRKGQIQELVSHRETIRARIAAAELRIEKSQFSALEKEKELEIASRRVSEANEGIVRLDRDISVCQERNVNLNQNIQRFDQDMLSLDKQVEESAQLRSQIELSVIDRETQYQKSVERVVGANDELSHFDIVMQQKRSQADQLGRDQIEVINQLGEVRNKLSTLKSNLSNAIERHDRGEREVQSLELRVEEYQDAIAVCRKQLAEADEEHRHLHASRGVLLCRIEKEDERYQGLVEKEKHLEAQIAASKSQLKFLAGLESAYEGYDAGVKELLTRKLPGLKGIVADLIAVNNEHDITLFEKVLGTAVQTVVFETESQVHDAVSCLQKERIGEARMVSLERLSSRRFEQNGTAPGMCAQKMVRVASGCDALAQQILGHIHIVDDSVSAFDASKNCSGDFLFVGRDGVICNSNGMVIAGNARKEKAGILHRKQQLEKLTSDIERYSDEYSSIVHEKELCIITRDEAKASLIEVDDKINRGQRLQQEQQTNIRHYENEILNILSRIQKLYSELSELKTRIVSLEDEIALCDAEVATMQSRRDALEQQVEKAREAVIEMEMQRRKLIEHQKNIELEVHGLKNRITQDKHDIERLTRDMKTFSERKQSKAEEKHRAQTEITDLDQRLISFKMDLEKQRDGRVELERQRDTVREAYNGILAQIEDVRKESKSDQSENNEISNNLHDAEIKFTRDEQEQRRIRERIWEAYEIDLESPSEALIIIEEDDNEVIQNISMLKERIKHVGQVNMAALDDYESESKRLNELVTQRDDLQNAVDELDKAIKKLDKEARTQFVTTFEQVQKNFMEMFTTLFEGGEAQISLEENVDPLEAPIHINVRPAGKKMRGVQLLSGGERALTAISLLFALYQVKPSAYCILDELDAPLDESNVGRFVRILRKFAEKTQFIVITHNKRTMEAADLLYGVTQQEKGVSTIVSVKFNESALQAA